MVESLIKFEKLRSKVLLKIVFVVTVFVSCVKAAENNNPICEIGTGPATFSTSSLLIGVPNPYKGIEPEIVPFNNPEVVKIVDQFLPVLLGRNHCYRNVTTHVLAATANYAISANVIAADRYEISFKLNFDDDVTGQKTNQKISLLADIDHNGEIQIVKSVNSHVSQAAGIYQ